LVRLMSRRGVAEVTLDPSYATLKIVARAERVR
jgi:hypothetical protein